MRHYFCFLRINYSFFKPLGTSYRVTRNPTQQVNIHENERWKAKLELQRHNILCRLCIHSKLLAAQFQQTLSAKSKKWIHD